MPVHLYVAPAGAGKTAHVLERARQAAHGLDAAPRVVVASQLQVRACRRRLAAAGGSLGVHVITFDRLVRECLTDAGTATAEVSGPVEHRLIRAAIGEARLAHYATVRDRPGFVQEMHRLITEFKEAGITPAALGQAVAKLGSEPRLAELARVYGLYLARLSAYGWEDRAGLAQLAIDILRTTSPQTRLASGLLAVDGFAALTPVQIALLGALAGRTKELMVTLTGAPDSSSPPGHELVYRRFDETRRRVEAGLGVVAEPLPADRPFCAGSLPEAALRYLADNLFVPEPPPPPAAMAAGPLELVEAAGREDEVRAALRWLKSRLIEDGLAPGQVALVARSVEAYRPFVLQIAAEYGLPVRLVEGLPLLHSPAIAALLNLLRLMQPAPDGSPGLPRRQVLEAWRSPYFDWSVLAASYPPVLDNTATNSPDSAARGLDDSEPHAESDNPSNAILDADALDRVARWGRVIGGQAQWEEALATLAARNPETDAEEDRGLPTGVPAGAAAQTLRQRFNAFVDYLTPPADAQSMRHFVAWLEGLIGPDPEMERSSYSPVPEPPSLGMVSQARDPVHPETSELDIAALRALKDVMRGLVWAEEALQAGGVASGRAVDFPRFVAELTGSIETASYSPPLLPDREEVLVADVAAMRGLSLAAEAVVGMAEGEFPATLSEDPFLTEADRARLRAECGLPLDSAIASAEPELFYETLVRPARRLLLVRPRLADNGAEWPASPFWEEVRRLSGVEPRPLPAGALPQPAEVASWPELLECLAAAEARAAPPGPLGAWAASAQPERCAALELAQCIVSQRQGRGGGAFDGDLSGLANLLRARYGHSRVWSASRLENYLRCPFAFFVSDVLGLEPRPVPAEGLDARQLGNIYHQIFHDLYTDPGVIDRCDREQLLAALPVVSRRVLDEAPAQEGFRASGWWQQTCLEIEGHVRESILALSDVQADYVPVAFEVRFWEPNELIVTQDGNSFRMHGVIDCIQRAPDGRLRVIDYKVSGPSDFPKDAFIAGKKLQLPLYALAAQDALGLGRAADGFYWHVQHAEPSKCTLCLTDGGVDEAIEAAKQAALAVISAIQAGQYPPQPPAGGCPSYCAAAAFCWHYQPRFGE